MKIFFSIIILFLLFPLNGYATESTTDWIFPSAYDNSTDYANPQNVLTRDGNVATSNSGGGLIRVKNFNAISLPANVAVKKVEIRFHIAGVRTTYRFQAGNTECQDHLHPGFYKDFLPTSTTIVSDYIVNYTNQDCNFNTNNVKSGNYFLSMFRTTIGLTKYSIDDISVRFTYDFTPEATPTPTPSTTPTPFLELPWDYSETGKSFDEIALDPNSWFDHDYPLQDSLCCVLTALNYAGNDGQYYESHNGYDYGKKHGVKLNTPVLAAASGIATFVEKNDSGGAGNLIKIDHGNGYQTWYEHLSYDDLAATSTSGAMEVEKGETIGRVGMTGNTSGPHIHFSVINDSNDNGSFNDDYPFGLVDPLGWEGKNQDPWELWEKNARFGSKSHNLFIESDPSESIIIPPTGGQIKYKNFTVNIPANAFNGTLTITTKSGPYAINGNLLKS